MQDVGKVEQALVEWTKNRATSSQWGRLGPQKRFGVCVPLFSLRSERDCGIGDIGDLYGLADWLQSIGATVLQLLPIQDMGTDYMPYSALSAFALDPVFLALDRIPAVANSPELMERLQRTGELLNGRSRIDYSWVRSEKMHMLEEAWKLSQNAETQKALAEFRAQNPWLADYIPYRLAKERAGYASWETWGAQYKDPSAVQELVRQNADRAMLYTWAQWLLDSQFKEAKAYLNSKGILIEGDIPILVARDSADVWRHPELFHMETSAGAPPDMYAEEGQNWGFPTYNWQALAERDYGWWRDRLRHAQRYFDLYRIDHVVGFFRIWTIKMGQKTGKDGWFVPWDEGSWGHHGYTILKMMLETSSMLPLAEDLGTIPHVCRNVLRDLGICGLKVQRWEKWWEGNRKFLTQNEYHPLSVATLSTHDSETVAEWWEKAGADRQELWELVGRKGPAPTGPIPADFHKDLLKWTAKTGSAFVVHLLQDLLAPFGLLPGSAEDHRVNVPGVVSVRNWSWRCPVTLEGLNTDPTLNLQLRELNLRG